MKIGNHHKLIKFLKNLYLLFRIQQLEGILLERNMNLRQLLSENFLMSARLKRLQSEFGVDAVKDALKGLN